MSTEVTITLRSQSEKLAKENPLGLSPAPLYHQMRTYEALKRADLVINTYNTGTGKTRAALLHLLRMPAKPDHNVLLIAPTNELVRQHQADVVKFVQEQELDWYVLPPIDAEELRKLRDRERAETDEHARNSRVMHDIIGNPRACFPDADTRKPFVMVTNPDLFYYCLYHCSRGGELDARNLFQDMLCRFDYIVIDEFHYYDPKQFANFLFFLTLLRRLGHFDGTKRVCLLSATPSASVRTYFQRLADLKPVLADQVAFRFEEIRPDNEPEEAADYPTLPALSPLRLILIPDAMALSSRVQADAESIQKRLADGEEGVILSGSMARIADIQAALRNKGITNAHMGAITGAAGRIERERAKQTPLILATPTVDIGYNFERSHKEWQSIDFLYGDARNAAELLQRIGRAGRVLGKKVTDRLSEATMCVPGRLRDAVVKSGKTEWERGEFAQMARENMTAPGWAEAYLNSWALLEAYQPLREFERTLPQTDVSIVQDIFADIKAVFAPNSDVTPARLISKIQAFQDRKTLQQAAQRNQWDNFSRRLLEKAAYGFCYRRFWENNEPTRMAQLAALPANQRRTNIQGMLRSGKNRQEVLEYAEAGYQRMRSLLTFRGSGIDLECGVFDPKRLLPSGAEDARYDLLHLLQNYDVQILTREQFQQAVQGQLQPCDCYAKIQQRAKAKHHIQLEISAEEFTRDEFKRRRGGYPIALRGFRLTGDIPDGLGNVLEGRYLTGLISSVVKPGALGNMLDWPELRTWPLCVALKDGDEMFSIVLGAGAFLVHAELRRYWQERARANAGLVQIEEPRAEPDDEEVSTEEDV